MVTKEMDAPPSRASLVPDRLLNGLSAAIFLAFAALYLRTLCPTVYWGDGAEYIITSFTLRDAHPTGYPLYSLLGKAATLLPLGSIAFRVNLLSAVLGAATLLLSFRLLARLSGTWLMPLAAATSFGLSRTFWSLSTISETLTLNLFLVALLLYLVLGRPGAGHDNWVTVAFFCGLACTNHFQALLALPGVGLIFLSRQPRWKEAASRVPVLALFFLLGFSVYAYLIIRSGYPYPNTYPDANTAWGFFSYYLGRSAYLGPDRLRGWSEVLGLVPQAARSIPRELGWPITLLVIPGLRFLWRRSWASATALLSIALLTIASAVFNGPTGNTYKMFLYSAQAYWALALLGCLGGVWLVEQVRFPAAARWVRPAVPGLCLVGAALLLRANLPYNDLSSHDWASRYAEANLATLPQGAVYLPGTDNPNNLSTYWRFVKGYRQDLALIPQEGLLSGYFHRRIKGFYPDLQLGGYETVVERLPGRGPLDGYLVVASFFRDLALKNPDRSVSIYPDIPEEALDLPRRPWGDNYEIQLPADRSGTGPASPAAWDTFEMDLARRAPPFLFDDFVIPGMADIHQRFGWLHYRQGNTDLAVKEYRRSVAILPSAPYLRSNFARLLQEVGRFDEAARQLERALETDPGNTAYLLAYGRALYAAGRFDELLAVGRRLVESGERFEGWYAQGLAQASLGRLAEAESAYREALSTRPEAFQVFNNLGVVYSLEGKKAEAAESFRKSLAINPGYESARQNLQRLK